MDVRSFEVPFPHLLVADVLPKPREHELLATLERLPWQPRNGVFYDFHWVTCADAVAVVGDIVGRAPVSGSIRGILEKQMGIALSEAVEYGVHRYASDAGIAPHTDESIDEVRLVVNFNGGWSLDDGGIWILSDCPDLSGARRYVPPLSNAGFAFRTSPRSFHALTNRSRAVSYAFVARYPLASRSRP